MANLFKWMTRKLQTLVNRVMRKRLNQKDKQRLKTAGVTLISSNCNGCWMLHDLGLRYNSPFVNLYIPAADYIKLLQDLPRYMEKELTFVHGLADYPVALLDDVHLYCVHYANEQDVRTQWERRKKRMDFNNVFVLFTDRDGCTKEHLNAFDALPFANKVVFTHQEYKDIASAVYVPGFEEQGYVGELHRFSGWSGRRYYDRLDYTAWFNGEGIHKR